MKKTFQHFISTLAITIFLFMAFGSEDDENKESKVETQSSSTTPDVEIIKQSATYEEVMNSYTVHCRVRNNTTELINYLDLKATFYDKEGNIVGTGLGNAANLAGGAEKTIDVIGLDIQNCNTYEVEVGNIIN
jgi:hypothetical protein